MTNTELTDIRNSLNLSKSDFAMAIGIAPVMQGKYEKGTKEIPESVIQAVYALMDTMKEETAPAADEEAASEVVEETAPVVEEAAPVVEEAAPVVEDASEEEEASTPTVFPLFLPPLMVPQCLLGLGYLFMPKKMRNIFWPWW